MNVFGATVPRQRSSSIDEHILNLQRQTYEDTLPDHEYDTQLQNLVHSYQDIFETECTQPANIPPVHVDVDLKPEDQQTIDQNYKKLIEQGKAKLNPTSIHNLGQVIVPRYDKDGKQIEDRARVCIDARPINKALIPYKYPIPSIKKIINDLSKKNSLQG